MFAFLFVVLFLCLSVVVSSRGDQEKSEPLFDDIDIENVNIIQGGTLSLRSGSVADFQNTMTFKLNGNAIDGTNFDWDGVGQLVIGAGGSGVVTFPGGGGLDTTVNGDLTFVPHGTGILDIPAGVTLRLPPNSPSENRNGIYYDSTNTKVCVDDDGGTDFCWNDQMTAVNTNNAFRIKDSSGNVAFRVDTITNSVEIRGDLTMGGNQGLPTIHLGNGRQLNIFNRNLGDHTNLLLVTGDLSVKGDINDVNVSNLAFGFEELTNQVSIHQDRLVDMDRELVRITERLVQTEKLSPQSLLPQQTRTLESMMLEKNATAISSEHALKSRFDFSHRLNGSIVSDSGMGWLVNGFSTVNLDPDFLTLAAMDDAHSYLIHLTPTEDSHWLTVVEQTRDSFSVKEQGGGFSNNRFYWRVEAMRHETPFSGN